MNRRLQALRVGNFKAFSATQRIPLKPITLVFGPNSAGKSSFIHSLALAHEAQFGREKRGRSRLDVHHTDIGGAAIDLGGFRQYIFRGQPNRRMEWGAEVLLDEMTSSTNSKLGLLLNAGKALSVHLTIGLELDNNGEPKKGAKPLLETCLILLDEVELLAMSRRGPAEELKGIRMRIDRIATSHRVFQQMLEQTLKSLTYDPLESGDLVKASYALDELIPNLWVWFERFLPSSVEASLEDDQQTILNLSPAEFESDREGDIKIGVWKLLPRTLDELIKAVGDITADRLREFQYLGPLRSFPPRHLAFADSEDANWYAGGGYAWEVVRRDDAVRLAVNNWLGAEKLKTRYKLVVRSFRALEDLHEPVAAALDGYDDWKQGRESVVSDLQETVDVLTFEVDELEREIEDLQTEIAGLEEEVEELEDETNQLLSEIDGMEFGIGEAESEMTLAETVRDLIETALDHDADQQVKKELASAHSKAEEQAQTLEWDRDALTSTRDDKQSELDDKKHELSQKQSELEEKQDELAEKQSELETKQSELDDKQSELNPYLGADMSEDRTEELLEVLKSSDSESIRELALIDQRTGATVSHRDVGIGISQVLPVLVMAYGSQDKILAMEQPEIHLHPALQAELGDVFIESALGARGNTFILETHSEHLILRLLRRIRETSDGELPAGATALRPEDITVIYVQPGPGGSEAIELLTTPDGDFKNKWPDGFFAERAQELF